MKLVHVLVAAAALSGCAAAPVSGPVSTADFRAVLVRERGKLFAEAVSVADPQASRARALSTFGATDATVCLIATIRRPDGASERSARMVMIRNGAVLHAAMAGFTLDSQHCDFPFEPIPELTR